MEISTVVQFVIELLVVNFLVTYSVQLGLSLVRLPEIFAVLMICLEKVMMILLYAVCVVVHMLYTCNKQPMDCKAQLCSSDGRVAR